MTIYQVKLVNHARATQRLQTSIQANLQDLFKQAFDGSSDSALVGLGTGTPNDSIVIHIVDDIASSYIQQQMKGSSIRVDAGGHTRTVGNVTGSEIYLRMDFGGHRSMVADREYARLAFHEALHNQFPAWSNADMHGPPGGGGLAGAIPREPMTQINKDLMRRGIAIKTPQLL